MDILVVLIPISLALGALGLGAFLWSLRSHQYDDPRGAAERILDATHDERPKADPPQEP